MFDVFGTGQEGEHGPQVPRPSGRAEARADVVEVVVAPDDRDFIDHQIASQIDLDPLFDIARRLDVAVVSERRGLRLLAFLEGADPFVDFDDMREQRFGFADREIEQALDRALGGDNAKSPTTPQPESP